MIYLNPQSKYSFHSLKATFYDNSDLRIHYTSDRRYYEKLVAKWGHLSDLKFEKIEPTQEQQDRLDVLNSSDIEGAEMYPHECTLFVQYGAIHPESDILSSLSTQQTTDFMLKLLKTELKDKAREHRWKVETGGTVSNGMTLRTDSNSQQRVGNLVTNVLADEDAQFFDFESQPEVWVTVDRETAIAIGKAVSQHVQSCFTRCKEIHEEIESKDFDTLDEVDIYSGWPENP